MSRTYTTVGINLKAMPLGENDRLLSVLTRDRGLLKLVAPHCRGSRSRLGGRVDLFVVNQLFIANGRSLDRILQAETVMTYHGLTTQLARITAAQYLGEVVLYQADHPQPQPELFDLLCATLEQLQQLPSRAALAVLLRSLYRLLDLSGIAPQWHHCGDGGGAVHVPVADTDWRLGFSFAAGGLLTTGRGDRQLTASEVRLGQWLATPATQECDLKNFLEASQVYPLSVWLSLERVLRQYMQFHFDKVLRVPPLLDTCFSPLMVPQP
ncbi:DNA repair protein RecO [Parathermosynechococcus lividus]